MFRAINDAILIFQHLNDLLFFNLFLINVQTGFWISTVGFSIDGSAIIRENDCKIKEIQIKRN